MYGTFERSLISFHPETPNKKLFGSRTGKEEFFVPARKSMACAEAYNMYAAQERPQTDADGAEKDPFRTGTN
jgi:hypothetical protein